MCSVFGFGEIFHVDSSVVRFCFFRAIPMGAIQLAVLHPGIASSMCSGSSPVRAPQTDALGLAPVLSDLQ